MTTKFTQPEIESLKELLNCELAKFTKERKLMPARVQHLTDVLDKLK